jgi:adenosine deaminase
MLDLHVHLGGAVPTAVLWEILCDGGLDIEFETFDTLQEYLTVEQDKIKSLDDFLKRYFHVTELIQSSPHAASAAVYQAFVKAYRRSSITGMEVRYNPLKRLRGGVHNLESIILASIQGMQRASMHYKLKTGIIFSMAKEQPLKANETIVEAAIEFHVKNPLLGCYGVVGLDMAGPESLKKDKDKKWLKSIAPLTQKARSRGLGITWHVGETEHTGPEAIENIIEYIQPDRIGHGIELRKARGNQRKHLCSLLRTHNICLELCPSVNLVTRSIASLAEMADLIRLLADEGIPFCLNTDNPYLIRTNLKREYEQMEQALGKDAAILKKSHVYAQTHSFMK